MTQPVATENYGIGIGAVSTTAFVTAIMARSPTGNDLNFPVQKRWLNSATGLEYFLLNFTSTGGTVQANWIQLTGGTTALNTLTGNSGGPISPVAGNINTVGDATTINVVGAGNTLTANVILPATAHQVLVGETSSIAGVTASATSGVPLISQGTGADPIFGTAVVAGGGTGATSFIPFTVVCGGSLATNPLQSVASVGTAGQVLVSNGLGSLPSFQSIPTVLTGYVAVTGPTTYTVQPQDQFVSVDTTGGAVTINLPNTTTLYRQIIVKDRLGNAATNNITVQTPGMSTTVDGSTSYVMNQNYQAIDVLFAINGLTSNYEVF